MLSSEFDYQYIDRCVTDFSRTDTSVCYRQYRLLNCDQLSKLSCVLPLHLNSVVGRLWFEVSLPADLRTPRQMARSLREALFWKVTASLVWSRLFRLRVSTLGILCKRMWWIWHNDGVRGDARTDGIRHVSKSTKSNALILS